VVNAAGPWGRHRQRDGVADGGSAAGAARKGSHIVVRKLFDHHSGYIFQNTDKRIVFALPFAQDFTLIGTTDENFVGSLDGVATSADEVLYLCRAVNEFFREPIGPEHVVWGVRRRARAA
jgi:glycerol-3-phosphate dehydrogenase